MKRRSRISHISVAAGISEHLHLVIDSARMPTGRIRQREISMHKNVLRGAASLLVRQRAMPLGQGIAKAQDLASGFVGSRRGADSVVQMNFDLAPPAAAKLRQLLYASGVVLFRRIKIGMDERLPLAVTKLSKISR